MIDQTTTIPKGWKMTTLGEVVDLAQGVAINAKTDFVLCGIDEGLPLLKINNLLNGTVDMYANPKLVTKKAILKKEDVIFTRTGQVGWVFTGKEGILHNNSFKVIPNEDIDGKFLYWFLKQRSVFDYVQRVASGSAQPDLNHAAFKTISIELPPLPEQRAIAAVLSSFDDKIELLREQNKTLEATAQAIFKEWFVNFNFPDADSKPYKTSGGKMIDSELGEIPEGWRVGTVNDVIERFSITYRCDQDDLSPKGKTPIFDQGTNGLYGYTERDADFQASTENPVILFTNHTCNMWFINYPFCAIQNVIPFRGNTEYSTFFVFYMTLGKVKFIEYKGHWPDFEQKKHIIPKPKIAKQFAEFVKPLQYKIWNNNFQIQTLSKLRDALLPKLMKGEVRVKGFKD